MRHQVAIVPVALLATLLSVVWLASPALAQSASVAPVQSEKGSVHFHFDYGYSFGLPGATACAGSVCSPVRKTLKAPAMGLGVKVSESVVAFMDLTALDSGWATATSGGQTVRADGSDVLFGGGVRYVGGKGNARGYVEASIGRLYESLTVTFNGIQETPMATSAGMAMFGAGVQLFGSPRTGLDVGFDVGHVAGLTFTRIRFGYLFQTKSAIK